MKWKLSSEFTEYLDASRKSALDILDNTNPDDKDSEPKRYTASLDILRAAGCVKLAGGHFLMGSWMMAAEEHWGLFKNAVRSLNAAQIDKAAADFYQRVSELEDATPSEQEGIYTELIEILLVRDTLQYVAACFDFLGDDFNFDLEQLSSIQAFDTLLREHLWLLTALGEWRDPRIDWIAPQHRARFWWHTEGNRINPQTVSHFDQVAELVALFPDAMAEFEARVQAALLMREVVAQEVGKNTLAEVVHRIEAASNPNDSDPKPGDQKLVVNMADGDTLNTQILSNEYCDISFEMPADLIVDIKVDIKEGLKPALQVTPELVLSADVIDDTVDSYRFKLQPEHLSYEVTLLLPAKEGELSILVGSPVDEH